MEQSLKEQQDAWGNNLNMLNELRDVIDQGLGRSCVERRLDEFIEELLEKYKLDSISFLVRSAIDHASWDGRYSAAVKEWAESVPAFPQPPGSSFDQSHVRKFYLYAHPCYVNIMANRIIKRENDLLQEKHDRRAGDR